MCSVSSSSPASIAQRSPASIGASSGASILGAQLGLPTSSTVLGSAIVAAGTGALSGGSSNTGSGAVGGGSGRTGDRTGGFGGAGNAARA